MTTIILSNGEYYKVPPGADPDAVRAMQERRIAREASPEQSRRAQPAKAKRTRRSYSPRTSKREQQYRSQAALTGAAMASLVERVNSPEKEIAE
jgi:hypothetical protein